jgi:hypothetical protein
VLRAGVTGPDDQCATVPFHDVIVSAAAESGRGRVRSVPWTSL